MSGTILQTSRLDIFPLTADSIEALLQGRADRLRALTNAEFPEPAPPPYMAESLPVVLKRLRSHPTRPSGGIGSSYCGTPAKPSARLRLGGNPIPPARYWWDTPCIPARKAGATPRSQFAK
jgi:hypothetical protein